MKPLVSVVIPVYKVEAYLERCVHSVTQQTYQNLEIILVDDGSPDRCGELCDAMACEDSRICVYHKPNGGLSDARNYGVAHSNGEYICFVDSDDYISLDYVEYLYELIKKYDADTAACCMVKTESDTAHFGNNSDLPAEQMLTGKQACEGLFGELNRVLVTAWGKMYKRDIAMKYPFPFGRKHEDEANTCKYYYESKRVAVGNRCLYAYYQNAQGIMNTLGTALNEDAIWAFFHRARFFEEKEEYELARLSWNVAIYYCLVDSQKYGGRCDGYLREIEKVKYLCLKEHMILRFWRIDPKLKQLILRCWRALKCMYRTVFRKLRGI